MVEARTGPQKVIKEAIKHEEKSYQIYKKAALGVTDKDTRKVFEFLAEEEIKHMKMLEDEYDRVFRPEN
ncbi:MAG: ferritin family protein [Nitrospirota bacterium]